MRKTIRYGHGSSVVELPAEGFRGILQPTRPAAIADAEAAIGRALEAPASGRPLAEIVRGRRRIVVVVPDATRAEVVRVGLRPLLAYLADRGVSRECVTVLIATGAHRPPSAEERVALVGHDLAAAWSVVAHDPDAGNIALEPLDADTPVAVDARVVESDCLILLSGIQYHYGAGFSGGRKLLAPGLCARATVQALHRRTLANIDAGGRWASRSGALRGNAFHEALVALARRFDPRFALHVSLDGQGRLCAVEAGEPFASHEAACVRHAQRFRIPLRERLPLVIASCGGWPYDIDLYQAHKSIDNAWRAVAEGGTLILLARCADGWGTPSFADWLAIDSLAAHRRRLEERFEVAGHTTYALKWKATQGRILVVSDALAQRLAQAEGPAWLRDGPSPFGLEIAATFAEALQRAAPPAATPYYLFPAAALHLPEPAP